MKDYQLTNWDDYWKLYEQMLELSNIEFNSEMISDFKFAKQINNGLTDG